MSSDTEKHILGFSIGRSNKGDVVTYSPEWNEWEVNGAIYNYRGSIEEGEVAMVLEFCRSHDLGSLLKAYRPSASKGEHNTSQIASPQEPSDG